MLKVKIAESLSWQIIACTLYCFFRLQLVNKDLFKICCKLDFRLDLGSKFGFSGPYLVTVFAETLHLKSEVGRSPFPSRDI